MKNHRVVAWQGWSLEIPRRWDPVKLEGDHSEGHALFADTMRPRLGLRWQTPKKKKSEPALAVQNALRAEVGQLAADEARPFQPTETPVLRYSEEPGRTPIHPAASLVNDSTWQSPLLYTEPEPPGRDVFSVYSETSGRLLQIAYHAHRRENLFATNILPTLADLPIDRATQWSIFDLNCVIPGGMKLRSQHLNAGDLALTFADRYTEVTVRQIAVAQLALQRQSLDGWIASQQKITRRYHHPTGKFGDTTLELQDRNLPARLSRMHRRVRYALMFNQPKTVTTIGAHDAERDRLILLHGTDESLLHVIGATVGAL